MRAAQIRVTQTTRLLTPAVGQTPPQAASRRAFRALWGPSRRVGSGGGGGGSLRPGPVPALQDLSVPERWPVAGLAQGPVCEAPAQSSIALLTSPSAPPLLPLLTVGKGEEFVQDADQLRIWGLWHFMKMCPILTLSA